MNTLEKKNKELRAWFESAQAEWDKINEKLEKQGGCNFFDFSLSEYFEYDNWKVSEAWLLLAGISPKPSLVDWDYIQESHEGAELGRIRLELVSPIKFNSVCEHPLELISEGELGFDSEQAKSWNEQAEKHAFVIGHYRNKLEKIVELWERTTHIDTNLNCLTLSNDEHRNHPVNKEYAINWALSKGLRIMWLDWAKRRGYFPSNETDPLSQEEAGSSWKNLSPPINSAEFALLCYQVANCLRHIPEREELKRELIKRFGKSHNITASNRTGESLVYDGVIKTHKALNKVRERMKKKQKKEVDSDI